MWCCYKLIEIPIPIPIPKPIPIPIPKPIPKPKPKIVPILREPTYFATPEIKTRSIRSCNNSTHVY